MDPGPRGTLLEGGGGAGDLPFLSFMSTPPALLVRADMGEAEEEFLSLSSMAESKGFSSAPGGGPAPLGGLMPPA